MTPKEAIAILTKERNNHHSFPTDIIGMAEQLGIEAIQGIQMFRAGYDTKHLWKLPSETDD